MANFCDYCRRLGAVFIVDEITEEEKRMHNNLHNQQLFLIESKTELSINVSDAGSQNNISDPPSSNGIASGTDTKK